MSEDRPRPNFENRYSEYKNECSNVRVIDTAHYVASLIETKCLDEKMRWVNQSERPRILVGGCYPGNSSFDNVSKFVEKLGFSVVVMDHNPDAVVKLKEKANEWIPSDNVFEGDLTRMPGEEKYDVIILDYTTAFMSDEQVGAFAKQAEERLSDGGVVMIMVDAPAADNLFFRFVDWVGKKNENKTDVTSRSAEKTIKLMSGHKCIYRQDFDGNVLLTFAKNDDARQLFNGGDAVLDIENKVRLNNHLGIVQKTT